MTEARRVLLVIGDAQLAEFVHQALAHPGVSIDRQGEQFVQALAQERYDVAFVGGMIGTRGPLVLCEAVRTDQRIPTVVLTGPNIPATALAKHREMSAADVHYFDPSGWRDPRGELAETGLDLRKRALALLQLDEDRAALEEWRESLEALETLRAMNLRRQERAAKKREEEEQKKRADEPPAPVAVPPPREKVDAEHLGPFHTELTDEDIEFTERTIDRLRSVDFRKETVASQTPVDAADVRLVQLRNRVRELERQLARLAFVYRTRAERFDNSEEATRELEAAKAQDEARIEALETDNAEKLRVLEARSAERERQFQSMLSDIREAFDGIKRQSKDTVAQLESQLEGRADSLAAREAELTKVREQLTRALDAHADATKRHDEIIEDIIERERESTEKLARAHADFAEEKAQWRTEQDQLRELGERIAPLEALPDRIAVLDVIAQQMAELDEMSAGLERISRELAPLRQTAERVEQLDAVSQQVARLEEIGMRVSESADRLSALEARMVRLDEVADRTHLLGDMHTRLAELGERLATLAARDDLGLAGIQEQLEPIARIETRLESLESMREQLEPIAKIEMRLESLESMREQLEAIEERVDALDGLEERLGERLGEGIGDRVTALQSTVENELSAVSAIEKRLARIEELDALDEHLDRLSQLTGRLDALGPLDELLETLDARNQALMKADDLAARFEAVERHLEEQDLAVQELAIEERAARSSAAEVPWFAATPQRFALTAAVLVAVSILTTAVVFLATRTPSTTREGRPTVTAAQPGAPSESGTVAPAPERAPEASGEPPVEAETPAAEARTGSPAGRGEDDEDAPDAETTESNTTTD